MIAKTALTLTIAASLAMHSSAAHAEQASGRGDEGSIAFVLDNDIFGSDSLDRDYTNGMEFSYLSRPARAPGWTPPLVRLLTDEAARVETRMHFAVGHQTFTPEDIELVNPPPDDRPYAGLLYAAAGAVVNQEDRRFDQIQLLLGVVGPASQADSLQIEWHDIINATPPNGWASQISNRPAAELSWRRTHVLPLNRKAPGDLGFGIQAAPHYGARVGNLTTALSIGGTVRIGWNLPIDVTPTTLSPNLAGSAFFKPTAPSGAYFFAGVDGRYVPRDLLLDEEGRDGFGVSREDFVGDAIVGVGVYLHGARLTYTHFFRTTQYEEQNRDGVEYGSLALTINF